MKLGRREIKNILKYDTVGIFLQLLLMVMISCEDQTYTRDNEPDYVAQQGQVILAVSTVSKQATLTWVFFFF